MENTRRRTVVNSSVSHPALQCHYKDILEKNIPLDYVSKVFISVADLDCDMSLLKQLMNQKPLPCIIFLDFESARYVDRILEDVFPEKCFLENDGQRISREYIDLSKLKHIQLSIPLDYLVWGVQFHDKVDTYCFKYNDFSSYVFRNGNGSLSKEDLQKIRNTIHQLSHYHTKDAVDKLCLISDYIQSRTQFIHGRESIGGGRCFITPDFPEHAPGSGLVETILNHQYGVCMGIANLSTLLLNNPDFDVRESEFIYHNGDLSHDDYAKELDYQSVFSYQDKPKYYSYLKK